MQLSKYLKLPVLLTGLAFGTMISLGQSVNDKFLFQDIQNFWAAYDRLTSVSTTADSNRVIQEYYLNKATPQFKSFFKLRNFKATDYLDNIRQYPAFWQSVRAATENVKNRIDSLKKVYDEFTKLLPEFSKPEVCFAIGNMRTGGTAWKNVVFIGTEIAAADSTVIKSELNAWLRNTMNNNKNIVAYTAHEVIHTQQSGFPFGQIFKLLKNRKLDLLNMCIVEGTADFLTGKLSGVRINEYMYSYAEKHECKLWKEFQTSYEKTPFDYGLWLYNGRTIKDRPADLGYFIGFKIAEAFYNRQTDKRKALKLLLKRGKYKKIFRESGYNSNNCS